MSPYVVTLAVDERAQARWDEERATWFPAGRTAVGAHVTLFHAVPGDVAVGEALEAAADRAAFAVRVAEVVGLGRGVAYRLASPELARVHASLRSAWVERLTSQDAQGFRPHVTVQNKVTAAVAARTRDRLAAAFTAYDVDAVGLDLWRYVGGPWELVRRFGFAAP